MIIVHLTASFCYGGPERQMLGLGDSLPDGYQSVFLSFAENGQCRAFIKEASQRGHKALALENDTPRLDAAVRELARTLRRLRAEVLCCHGYKADVLGRLAARWVGIPAVAVSRGWTGGSCKMRLFEVLDRLNLRWMDRVVCVSEGQAVKVRRAGVAAERVVVIHNAIQAERFERPDPSYREVLHGLFAGPRDCIVGAAGRLSPEKGFEDLIEAARAVMRAHPAAGIVIFGDGPLRAALARQVQALGLGENVVLAGFRRDLDALLPHLDLLVLPSYTEGLPNVVLEASAARVSVVATAVGGTPEAVEDGITGFLVPPGDPAGLARRIVESLESPAQRARMGRSGRKLVEEKFTFDSQSRQYRQLFEELAGRRAARGSRDAMASALITG